MTARRGRIRLFLAELMAALSICAAMFIPYILRALFGA